MAPMPTLKKRRLGGLTGPGRIRPEVNSKMSAKARKETLEKAQAIKVFPRIRPMNASERDAKTHNILDASDNSISVKHMNSSKRYVYDHVFDKFATQQDIYNYVVSPMVFEVLNGFSCTVFAYGQTGTGKTFTMAGGSPEVKCWREDKNAGIIPRALAQLFELLQGRESTVRVSYIELYNEEIIDLLSDDELNGRIRLYDDAKQKGSVIIQGAEEVTVREKNEVYALLDKGMIRRQTACTLMNASSSRSHTVFIINVHTREVSPEGEDLVKVGKLYLVDLAGSENIARSGATDKRARETAMINQSLLTLGRVIQALVSNNSHVPYRESKLTRILQDSLGGRSKTSLIVTVSPASNNTEETINTLEYGSRARNIHNRPEVNQRMSKAALINAYVEEIDKLKKDLAACRNKDGVFLNPENYDQLLADKQHRAEELLQRMNEIKLFQERIDLLETQRTELERNFHFTEQSLTQSQTRLDHCKASLLKVKKKNKIRDEYIRKVCQIEERYLSDNAQLMDFAMKTYDNECYFHRKTDQFYKAFMENIEKGSQVLNESQETSAGILSSVRNFSNTVVEKCNDVVQGVNTEASVVRDHVSNLNTDMKQALNLLLEHQKQVSAISVTIRDASNESKANLQNMLKTLQVALSKTTEQSTECLTIVAKSISSLHELSLGARNIQDIVTNNAQKVSTHVVNFTTDICAATREVMDMQKETTEKIVRNAMSSKDFTGHSISKVDDLMEHLVSLKSMLKFVDSQNANQIKEIHETERAMQCKLNTIEVTNKQMETEVDKQIHGLNDRVLSEVKKMDSHINSLNIQLSDANVVLDEIGVTSKDTIPRTMVPYESISKEVDAKIVTLLDNSSIVMKSLQDNATLHHESITNRTRNIVNVAENSETISKLNTISTLTSEHAVECESSLPALTKLYERFIKTDMNVVEKSGKTPVKSVLTDVPSKRLNRNICSDLASKLFTYDLKHEESFTDEENINPDVSMVLDSSQLQSLDVSLSESPNLSTIAE